MRAKDIQELLLEPGILTTLNGTGFSGELKYEIRPQKHSRLRFGL